MVVLKLSIKIHDGWRECPGDLKTSAEDGAGSGRKPWGESCHTHFISPVEWGTSALLSADVQGAQELIGGWTCLGSPDFKVIAGSVNSADWCCISPIADLTSEPFRAFTPEPSPCALNGLSVVTASDALYVCPASSKSLGWASEYSGKKRERQLFSVIEFWRS